ncbi:MAG: hypothetical protein M0P16_10835 [Syntrophales bacterium]|jgi:DNA-binding MltR family transcriptional regulator|nr:hypothetical protein [Syntrophales bacterium]
MKAKGLEPRLIELLDEFLDQILNQTKNADRMEERETTKTKITAAFKDAGIEAQIIPDVVLELRDLLGRESDRGCVLTAAAYLDNELAKLLQKVLIQDEKLFKELFDGTGPLATFSSRIDLAYGLGYLAPLQRRDLHLIRKIRNIFAHRTGEITFDDNEVSSRCLELYHDVFGEKLAPRKKFIRVAMGIAAPIHASMMNANRPVKAKDIDLKDQKFKTTAETVRKSITKEEKAK